MATKIQMRRDTAVNWKNANPILMEGEMGIVTDNPNQYKIGDGIHAWNDLPLRGYTGTIAQDTGYDENAVMSQKVTTEKLTEFAGKIGGYEFINYYLETNGYWRRVDNKSVSYCYPVKAGDKITIKANNQNAALVSLVGSIGNVGEQADYIGNTPWINDGGIQAGTNYSLTVSSGANYLVVMYQMFSSDIVRMPQELLINGYDYIKSVAGSFMDMSKKIVDTNELISKTELELAANIVTNDFGKYILRTQLPFNWNGSQFVSSTEFGCYIMPAQWMHKYSRNKNTDYIYSVVELGSLDLTDIINSQSFTTDFPLIVTNKNTKFLVFTCGKGEIAIIDDAYDNLIGEVNATKLLTEKNSNLQICTEYINGYNNGAQIVENDATNKYKTFVIPLEGDSWYTLYHTFTDFVLLTDYPSLGSYESIKVKSFAPYYSPYSFYVPKNVKYAIGTAAFDTPYIMIGKAQRPLNIVCFGDSIVEFKTYDNLTYPHYISQYLKIPVTNIGIGGTRICARTQGEITTINNAEDAYSVLDLQHLVEYIIAGDYTMIDAANDWLVAHPETNDDNTEIIAAMKQINWNLIDVVILHYTGNDSLDNLGEPTNMHNATILGELNYAIKRLQEWRPQLKVLIVSPIYSYNTQTGDDSDDYVAPVTRKTIRDRIDGEEEVAKINKCPYLNIYDSGIFNKYNRDFYYTKYGGSQNLGSDGTHPWNGFELLGRRIGGWIREILCL